MRNISADNFLEVTIDENRGTTQKITALHQMQKNMEYIVTAEFTRK